MFRRINYPESWYICALEDIRGLYTFIFFPFLVCNHKKKENKVDKQKPLKQLEKTSGGWACGLEDRNPKKIDEYRSGPSTATGKRNTKGKQP